MIFEQPVFKPGGDRNLLMYLGDEMSFDLNFLVHSVARRIRDAEVSGLIELIPEMASILVSYDPNRIAYGDLIKELTAIYGALDETEGLELDSRVFYVPILYFDPWTAECVEDYRANLADKEFDVEMVIRLNELEGREQFVRVHSGTEYWVAALGFWPGLCSLLPLDPRSRMNAPKYNPPRTWTPKGTIGIGGAITCIYPDRTPGGYQIFARSPMPIWDRDQRLAAFKDSLALFLPGDRVRFVPIDRAEYDYIDAKVAEGSYKHPLVAYQRFSIRSYHAWLETIDPAERL
ncbi:MAG: carboxyltransferase domain-containing protein [Kiloniellales bacterium]|nr:carboxyltransferase domain-containing protein [Kiloniellales bacterium]